MVAQCEPCRHDQLRRLLEETLSTDDERRVVEHLNECSACCRELQRLVGDGQVWQLARDTLSEGPHLNGTAECSLSGSALDQRMAADDWIMRLLQPSSHSESLGVFDGRDVRGVIGQGGMGVVLKVWDAQLQRPLAIKLLSPMLAGNAVARQRFFREAQAAASVVHPNIVPIYTVTADGPLPYIVMPLVGGGSLQQRLDRTGPMELREVLSMGLQICEGLTVAHAQGLVHRDIKPANILLDENGHRVLISDFGLARTLDDASMTASGLVAGTPNYMSPEQARGETVDARSDLYSLGVVLYVLATGRLPFRGDSPLAILRRVCDEVHRPAHEVNEQLPLWFNRLIGLFMEKNAVKRMASAESAADVLRSCLAHVRAPSRNPLPNEVRSRRRFAISRPISLIALTCFALAATAMAVPFLLPNRQSSSAGSSIVSGRVLQAPANAGRTTVDPSNYPTTTTSNSSQETWNEPTYESTLVSSDWDVRIESLHIRIQLLKREIQDYNFFPKAEQQK